MYRIFTADLAHLTIAHPLKKLNGVTLLSAVTRNPLYYTQYLASQPSYSLN